jgi:hypothetical protein
MSCCTFCPFASDKPDILARYRAFPKAAAEALLLENVSMALNPNSFLYRDRSLVSVLEKAGHILALRLFEQLLEEQRWALYRVRRVYTSKGHACRLVEKLLEGKKEEMQTALKGLAAGQTVVEVGSLRAHVIRRKRDTYPCQQEMLVVAPALAEAKAKRSFGAHWERVALRCLS